MLIPTSGLSETRFLELVIEFEGLMYERELSLYLCTRKGHDESVEELYGTVLELMKFQMRW